MGAASLEARKLESDSDAGTDEAGTAESLAESRANAVASSARSGESVTDGNLSVDVFSLFFTSSLLAEGFLAELRKALIGRVLIKEALFSAEGVLRSPRETLFIGDSFLLGEEDKVRALLTPLRTAEEDFCLAIGGRDGEDDGDRGKGWEALRPGDLLESRRFTVGLLPRVLGD